MQADSLLAVGQTDPVPEPLAEAPLPQAEAQPAGFKARRTLIFLSIFVGYASYYITRTSLTYAAPLMVADASLGISLPQVTPV
jgi:MFS transporter, OPA family, sugar phosphate sensor protein UhpC